MATRKYLLIANPVSGQGHAVASLSRVAGRLEEAGLLTTQRESQHAGDIEEMVASCDPETYTGVCIAGGDGSVRECATGLQRNPQGRHLCVGMIGSGTGNSIHRALGLGDLETCVARIIAGQTRPIDLLRVDADQETFYGVNLVGWGAAASLGARAESMRWLGRSRYAFATLVEVARATKRRAELVTGEQVIADSAFLILGCNTEYGGWQMRLAPQASITDGLIDLTVVHKATRLQLLRLFSKVYSGRHVDEAAVHYLQVPNYSIVSDEPHGLNLDGDVLEGRFRRVDVAVVQEGMNVY